MKAKYISGLLFLSAVAGFTSCDDEQDYTISTQPVVQSITTSQAEVTANSAIGHGAVANLETLASSSYEVGFYYVAGDNDPKTGLKVAGSYSEGNITAQMTGLETNMTYTYCAYVTLQKSVTYYGQTEKFVTINANVTTQDAKEVSAASAVICASVSETGSVDLVSGVAINTTSESVKNGFVLSGDVLSSNNFELTVTGLMPNTTYYYAPFVSPGHGCVYGEVKSFTTSKVEMEWVDLGLGVEVATMNLGADSKAPAGGNFTYGDVKGLGIESAEGNIFGSTKDAATVAGLGRMATLDEIRTLLNACSVEETVSDGMAGVKVTGPTGNSVFFPAGRYWTGSASGDGFASVFEFSGSSSNISAALTNTTAYIRAFRKAPVAVDANLLNTTWYIDLDQFGNCAVFDGPLYYYGTDDSWTTVSDGDMASGDSWNWCPVWKDNTWLCEAKDYGKMTFSADGKVVVEDLGNGKNYEGTYTFDTENKTLSLVGAEILHLPNFHDIVTNWSTSLKVLSLTDKGLQIAALRDNSNEGPCLLVHNFCSEAAQLPVWQGVPASLSVSDPNWAPSIWANANYKLNADVTGPGTYTAKAILDGEINGVNVFCVDIIGFAGFFGADAIENTEARIDKITIDGNNVPCDNDKIITGDIEGNGNYRIEIYNEYGAGTKDSQPIDISLMKGSSVEVTFTLTEKVKGYNVNFMTCDTNWNWKDHTTTQQFEEGKQYTFVAADAQSNAMIDCIDIEGFAADYPNAIFRVDEIKVDGQTKAFDANKFGHGDVEGKGNYRIELFNTYGKTGETDSDAFGEGIVSEGGNKAVSALACTEKIEVTVTLVTLNGLEAELTLCDSGWASAWPDAMAAMPLNNLFPLQYTITFEGARADGMINLVELKDVMSKFPNLQLSLVSVKCDGNEVQFDASKILTGDLEGKGNYRIELYNTYGASRGNAAFAGETEAGTIPALGFAEKCEVTISLDKLF